MTYLRNAWYCAGFSEDLKHDNLMPMTLLGEKIVLYRTPVASRYARGPSWRKKSKLRLARIRP